MNTHRNLEISDTALSKSLAKLSSGYRINSAADDAAGLAISQGFSADIASYKVASRNASEASSLLQVAEGATNQISSMLTRLKELATQAASANAGSNLDKINAEGDKLISEIDRISQSTEYAGSKLLNGTFGVGVSTGTFTSTLGFSGATGLESAKTYTVATATGGNITVSATLAGGRVSQTVYGVTAPGAGATKDVSFASLGLTLKINSNFGVASDGTVVSHTATASNFQIGAKNTGNDRIGILLGNTTSAALGLSSDQLLSASNAQTMLTTIDTAIGRLSSTQGDIGAAMNRLTYASANLSTTIQNVTAAESTIRDVDMADEMTTFTKNQILMQAGTAMLAQANAAPQNILSLLK